MKNLKSHWSFTGHSKEVDYARVCREAQQAGGTCAVVRVGGVAKVFVRQDSKIGHLLAMPAKVGFIWSNWVEVVDYKIAAALAILKEYTDSQVRTTVEVL